MHTIFNKVYNNVTERHPLYVKDYRYGGYYGLLVPCTEHIEKINNVIDYDKTSNLINFFGEYQCFPYGRGDSHLEVIQEISRRAGKWFDDNGNWKLEVWHPERTDPEEWQCESFDDVINEILSWFKASKSEWYVIDEKRHEKHWLFKALDDAMQLVLDNENFDFKDEVYYHNKE